MSTALTIPKSKFRVELELQIAEGRAILEVAYTDIIQFEEREKQYRLWNAYNKDFLKNAFTVPDSEYFKEYEVSRNQVKKLTLVSIGHDSDSFNFRQGFFTSDFSEKIEHLESLLSRIEFIPQETRKQEPVLPSVSISDLAHLHPTVQTAASKLFSDTHYPQAIQAASTALDKAVQAQAQLPASTVGTSLMTTAFSPKAPLIQLSQDSSEQTGFMNLYQGQVQALRNHYAHNLTTIPAARALEWLGFLSALFYKLEEAQSMNAPLIP
ncbi:MAG: TIGR02391 family protein [Janthinobacterium lividum]